MSSSSGRADSVSVYRRRAKDTSSSSSSSSTVAKGGDNCDTNDSKSLQISGDQHHAKSLTRRRHRSSWVGRSLSSRGTTNTVDASTFAANVCKSNQTILPPNAHRKKRVGAPAGFVQEQRNYFSQVDAFELEEDTSPQKESWTNELKADGAIIPNEHFYVRKLLQPVQEDTPEKSASMQQVTSPWREPLVHMLKTPYGDQILDTYAKNGVFKSATAVIGVKQAHIGWSYTTDLQKYKPASESGLCSMSPGRNSPIIIIDSNSDEEASVENSDDVSNTGDAGKSIISRTESDKALQIVIDLNTPESIDSDILERRPLRYNFKHVKYEYDTSGGPDTKDITIFSGDEYKAVPDNQDADAENTPQKPGLENSGSDQGSNSIKWQHNAHAITITGPKVGRNYKQGSVTKEQRTTTQKHESESKVSSEDSSNLNDDLSDLTEGMHALRLDICQAQEPMRLPASQDVERSSQQAKQPLAFEGLLRKCGQKEPLKLRDALSEFSNITGISKLGEGTYGEAFKGSNFVFKIVPMGGSLLVNGEVQKSFLEMYTEVLLCLTLNKFREENDSPLQSNICNNFIETKTVRVCRGMYDQALINAWEEWDAEHESENDHPSAFPPDQLYMLFVLADGGKDLESFVVTTFDIARSILIQVTAALAVAEEACEFEHRDLHWGNILVSQTSQAEVRFKLNGADVRVKTHGVFVQIIDFTLSRLHTGTEVLFADLSADPALFEGRKGDIQAETYRRMLHLTEGRWSSSFLKTNCYWIHYLAEILLSKKLAVHKLKANRDAKELRSFKKRLLSYDSAKMCLQMDPLFDPTNKLDKCKN